jgi:glycosyltransferase involved in cell wall biosynthesis
MGDKGYIEHMAAPRFLVVIPSYNNEIFCAKNLLSVLGQDYPHFRVIYIDDASTDSTLKLVKELGKGVVEIVENRENRGALANIYHAVELAEEDEIVVNVDGDDWLKHKGVLSHLAKVYGSGEIWLSYGQYEHYPSGILGHCRPFESPIRRAPWVSSHLRSYYAALFKKIRREDLLYEGKFFPVAGDLAFMIPMIEMAGEKRVKFIPEILYVYNGINPLRDGNHRYEMQQEMGSLIRSRPPYKLLQKIFA